MCRSRHASAVVAAVLAVSTQLTLGPTAVLARDGAEAPDCDGTTCYVMVYNTADSILYADAQADCASNYASGTLASATSAELTTKFVDIWTASGLSSHLWIGLNDIAVEGTYVWEGGEAFAYTNWAAGEPSGASEDCVYMRTTGDVGEWNDWACATPFNRNWMCQYPDPNHCPDPAADANSNGVLDCDEKHPTLTLSTHADVDDCTRGAVPVASITTAPHGDVPSADVHIVRELLSGPAGAGAPVTVIGDTLGLRKAVAPGTYDVNLVAYSTEGGGSTTTTVRIVVTCPGSSGSSNTLAVRADLAGFEAADFDAALVDSAKDSVAAALGVDVADVTWNGVTDVNEGAHARLDFDMDIPDSHLADPRTVSATLDATNHADGSDAVRALAFEALGRLVSRSANVCCTATYEVGRQCDGVCPGVPCFGDEDCSAGQVCNGDNECEDAAGA